MTLFPMHIQCNSRYKILIANNTRIGSFPCMGSHMNLKSCSLFKTFLAKSAFVRFFTSMCSFVHNQQRLPCKTLPTGLANEWFFPSVNFHVIVKLGKTTSTDVTNNCIVWFLLVMHIRYVSSPNRFIFKLL